MLFVQSYNGIKIPTTINTNERIFKIVTFDDEIILCNTSTAKLLINNTRTLDHFWGGQFRPFPKKDLKEMKI